MKKRKWNFNIALAALFVLIVILTINSTLIFLFNIERNSILNHGRPDWFYLYFLNPDENKLKTIEIRLQPIIENLCESFPVEKCPKLKVFTWSMVSPLEVINILNNPTILMTEEAVDIFDPKELEAAIAHEYGHLLFRTPDQKIADKFAAEVIGKKHTIGFLKKLSKFNYILFFIVDIVNFVPGKTSRRVNREIAERTEALGK